MQSGYTGAKNTTCEDCRWILKIQETKEYSWYEVTDGNMSKSFDSQIEAEMYLREMRKGFPDNENVKDESKLYWKKVGKRQYVTKVTQRTVCVSY